MQEVAISKNGVLMFGKHLALWTALYRLHGVTESDVSTIALNGQLYRRATGSSDVLHRLTDMVASKGYMTFF